MKKLFAVIVFLCTYLGIQAQVSTEETAIAMKLISANAVQLNINEKETNKFFISSTYFDQSSGIRMVYLQQKFIDIPVFNQMAVLAFKDGKLVSSAGGFIQSIDEFDNFPNIIPKVAAEQAVETAILDQLIIPKQKAIALKKEGDKISFGNLGVSYVNITAELIWLPVNSKKVILTWQVEIAPIGSADHLLIRVDAQTGRVVDKNNYTVYERFNELYPSPQNNGNHQFSSVESVDNADQYSPSVVSAATYRVIPFPAESPNHTGGTAALVTDPWTLAPGNATSLLWHYDNTAYRDSTRGNNVWAQEDRDNNNNTYGKTATSSSAQPSLTFDNFPNYTLAPTNDTFQKFAITNLFYWNNLTHDLLYNYGFNEAAGNFQANNQSRGGSGNDYVIADAQDAGGTNNANFSTPVDGSAPRMQMYLFTYNTPNRDGDLDNGVITHEYGHGLSNRLTGGPANSSCLNNAEQGGEGWSDYLALMMTTNWSTTTVNDGTLSKPIGTYVLGQSITGSGIRNYPYSTNMSINPWTYGMMNSSGGEVHKIGEIWCAVLWDMTWELIAIDGINNNIFNASGVGGNSAALKLVVEGMRLQPCSPGYIDARNAILKADTLFFAGKYSCAIWKAFARRGMGKFASQGSSNSTTDQVEDFTNSGGLSFRLTQSASQQNEGQSVTYNHIISAGSCSGISNYMLRDTLPNNVTYVSGGTYDSVKRIVSFSVSLSAGATQTYAYTVKINNGTYFPTVTYINDSVISSTVSSIWTKSSTTTTNWTTSTAQKTSGLYSLFTSNLTSLSDQKLETTNAITIPSTPVNLIFNGYINSESGWDGGVVEISNNNGTSWTDVKPYYVSGSYNSSLGSSSNPLSGRYAFSGNSNGFVKSNINLSSFAGQSIKIRFRFGSDASVAATGWYLDDIQMKTMPQVIIRSNLFNSNNSLVAYCDTATKILQAPACSTATISAQPNNMVSCVGGATTTSVTASGTSLTYQWQVSSDSGSSFSNISGAIASQLSVNNITYGMNGYQYRCVINGACTVNVFSSNVSLSLTSLPNSPSGVDASRCGTGTLTLSASAGVNETIDWYAASSGGTLLTTGTSYTTPSISITTTYYAASRSTSTACVSGSRTPVIASVIAYPSAPLAIGGSGCGTGTVTIAATPGNGESINWYAASSGGNALLTNSNSFTSPVISATTTYYAAANKSNCLSVTRSAVIAIVNALPSSASSISNASRCGSDTATIAATASNGMTIDWYGDSTSNSALQIGTISGVNKYLTPVLSSTTTYWVAQRNLSTNCKSAARVKVIVTINAKPSAPSASGASRCGAGTVSLSATLPTNPSGTVAWYTAALGGAALGTSSTYTTPSISSTTTYYVEAKTTSTGCVSASRTPVVANINAIPSAPIAGTSARCGSGTVVVSATPGAGQTVDWYSASSNGNLLLSGSTTYTTPSISSTKTYYALARNASTSCISSSRTAVKAVVSSSVAAPTTLLGLTSVCSIVGTPSSTTYTSSSVTGALSYIWTIPSGAVIDSGTNGTKIKLRFNTAGNNDSISVQAYNGCTSAKKVLKLITTGCVTTSRSSYYSQTFPSTESNEFFSLFPNPSVQFFNVQSKLLGNTNMNIKVMDMQGRLIQSLNSKPAQSATFGKDLRPGVYCIQITQGEHTQVYKAIKE